MNWKPLGFDVRYPFTPQSGWQVGDFPYEYFIERLGGHSDKLRGIISADLNLSRRPWDIDLTEFHLWTSRTRDVATSLQVRYNAQRDSKLLFYEMDVDGVSKSSEASWFKKSPRRVTQRPEGLTCLGIDIVNDDMISELWEVDLDEAVTFWSLDDRLAEEVNEWGLLCNSKIVEQVMPHLSLHAFCDWAAAVRIWSVM